MASPNILNHKGFTLIEVIIALGIVAIIAGLGLFVGFDFYRSYSFRSEKTTMVSVLQKARSQSINNINEKRHGVHFFLDPLNNNQLTYAIFECSSPCVSYSVPSSSDTIIVGPYSVGIISPSMPPDFDVVFDQLSGCLSSLANNCSATPVTITVADASRQYTITINSEGAIDW